MVKLDKDGSIEWENTYGASDGPDWLPVVKQTNDSGYILVATTWPGIDKVGDTIRKGSEILVVRLDNSGEVLWEQKYGAYGEDGVLGMEKTFDGGFIISGILYDDGFIPGHHGGEDMWVIKLDAEGSYEWEKILGGQNQDMGYQVIQLKDSSYVVAGLSESFDGDLDPSYPLSGRKKWLVRLDQKGNIIWEKKVDIGYDDGGVYPIAKTPDGGFIIGSYILIPRTSPATLSQTDGAVTKFDADGNILWQKQLGGSLRDYINGIVSTFEDSYILIGASYSNDSGIVNKGGSDIWVVNLSNSTLPVSNLNLTASRIGQAVQLNWSTASENNNKGFYVQRKNDNSSGFTDIGFVATKATGGNSASLIKYAFNDFEKSLVGKNLYRLKQIDKNGNIDYSKVVTVELDRPNVQLYPNPVVDVLNIRGLNAAETTSLSIFNMAGKLIANAKITADAYKWNVDKLPAGTYYLSIEKGGKVSTVKFVK